MRTKYLFLSVLCLTVLSGCFDKEEQAQTHYESALSLIEEGEPEKAMLELRNAIQNDGFHEDARRLYADRLLEGGDIQGAYSQYLRLVEQYPNTADVRRLLAEIALDDGNWEQVDRHGRAAFELEPELPEHKALVAILDYREAGLNGDTNGELAAVDAARELLEADPDLLTALRLLVEWEAIGESPENALPYLDRLLELHPNSQSLLMARIRILDTVGRDEEIGEGLQELNRRFPENPQYATLLLQWHLSRGDLDEAENFLRVQAGADDGPTEGHFVVIQMLEQTQGREAALAELDRLIAANAGTDIGFRYAAEASLKRFEDGDQSQIEQLETTVASMEDTQLKNNGRYVLSTMYRAVGRLDEARDLIGVVLAEDPSHVNSLTVRASDFIADGDPSSAVNDLRAALDQSPRNSNVLLVLAGAHQRLGNVALAEQRLAQAVEFSEGDPDVALAYAGFLSTQGNSRGAERVLVDNISEGGINLQVAETLARIQLSEDNTEGAKVLLQQLVDAQLPGSAGLVRDLQATILFNEDRIEDSLEFLRNSLDEDGDGTDDLGVELQMLRIQMLSGRFDDARTELDGLRERFPEARALRIVEANLFALEDNLDEAIVVFNELVAEDPSQVTIIQRLYATLKRADRAEEATELLLTSLDVNPDAPTLLLMNALEQEEQGDVDGAIASYERLHAGDPNSLTVVNNYASMLAYYRTDDASLELASQLAAPLNGSNVPAFLDTLGYIQLRQGEVDEAILNLQAAARGLPDSPTVAFNLATAYARAGRNVEAETELGRGFELAGDNKDLFGYDAALELLDELPDQPEN